MTESVSVLRSKTDEARSVKKTGLNVLFLASGEQFIIATGATGSNPVLRIFIWISQRLGACNAASAHGVGVPFT